MSEQVTLKSEQPSGQIRYLAIFLSGCFAILIGSRIESQEKSVVAPQGTYAALDKPINQLHTSTGRWARRRQNNTSSAVEKPEHIRELESIGYVGGSLPSRQATGVVRYIEEKVAAGINLYTSGHAPEALLVDMQGQVLYRWHKTFLQIWPLELSKSQKPNASFWRRAFPYPNGDILVIHEGLGIVKLDKNSNIIWANPVGAHHDLDVAENGDIWVLTRKAHIAPEVDTERAVLEDFISVLDPEDGRQKMKIRLLDVFARTEEKFSWRDLSERFWREFDRRRSAAGRNNIAPSKYDIFHTNSLQILQGSPIRGFPEFVSGNILISMCHLDVAAVIDPAKATVSWISPFFSMPHDPSFTPEGHLMIFDNHWEPYKRSRVVMVDLKEGETVWEFAGTMEDPLFSATCGAAQRLSNGNILVTESDNGRVLEVNRGKEVVWEYSNPHVAGADGEFVAAIFELMRLPVDYFSFLEEGSLSGDA